MIEDALLQQLPVNLLKQAEDEGSLERDLMEICGLFRDLGNHLLDKSKWLRVFTLLQRFLVEKVPDLLKLQQVPFDQFPLRPEIDGISLLKALHKCDEKDGVVSVCFERATIAESFLLSQVNQVTKEQEIAIWNHYYREYVLQKLPEGSDSFDGFRFVRCLDIN